MSDMLIPPAPGPPAVIIRGLGPPATLWAPSRRGAGRADKEHHGGRRRRPFSQAERQRIANPPSPVQIREGPLFAMKPRPSAFPGRRRRGRCPPRFGGPTKVGAACRAAPVGTRPAGGSYLLRPAMDFAFDE